jgi:hypothetical protein
MTSMAKASAHAFQQNILDSRHRGGRRCTRWCIVRATFQMSEHERFRFVTPRTLLNFVKL